MVAGNVHKRLRNSQNKEIYTIKAFCSTGGGVQNTALLSQPVNRAPAEGDTNCGGVAKSMLDRIKPLQTPPNTQLNSNPDIKLKPLPVGRGCEGGGSRGIFQLFFYLTSCVRKEQKVRCY